MKADPESGAQSNMADVVVRRGRQQGCPCIERRHGWAQEEEGCLQAKEKGFRRNQPCPHLGLRL